MENHDFDQFVKRQQAEASAVAIDWDHEREEWLAYLSQLYKKVESLLGAYLSSGQILVRYAPIDLNEQNIGAYTAKQMILGIGRQEVVLRPIGTLLIGFKGRVDVEGPLGRRQIALVDSSASGTADIVHVSVSTGGQKKPMRAEKLARVEKKLDGEPRWTWRIVTRPPERSFVEITQRSLFELILDVANV
jgi:hypothetical protein